MFNESEKWDELVELWPKKQGDLYWARDKAAFSKKVKSDEDFEKLKNHIECLLEDSPINKIGSLSDIINDLFKSNKKSAETQPQVASKPVLDHNELYQKTNDPELSRVFIKIWEVWPRMPDFLERRSFALEAFLSAARVLPLSDIETACLAYANAFGDGSMTYPKSLKRFLGDKEGLDEWLQRANNKKGNEVIKKQFEAAYANYPQFTGKGVDKTREASWVAYWRAIKSDEKLDFLAMVKLYRRQRKGEMIDRDQSEEECVMYTKSFVAFVGEWRQLFTGNKVAEAKADIFAEHAIAYAKELGLDLNNIWGFDFPPFFVRVLTYLCGTAGNIKEALREGIQRTVNLVTEAKNDPKKYHNILDMDKAIKEIENLDVDGFSTLVYNKILETKLYEIPLEVKK